MNLRWLGIALSCIFSWNIMKASVENDALWQVRATDLHAPYASAPMASGCIGILPDK